MKTLTIEVNEEQAVILNRALVNFLNYWHFQAKTDGKPYAASRVKKVEKLLESFHQQVRI